MNNGKLIICIKTCRRCGEKFNDDNSKLGNPFTCCPPCRAAKWDELQKLAIKKEKVNETERSS